MACFTSTVGPIGWSYIAEILQVNQLGIATSCHWVVTGIISFIIPFMLENPDIGGNWTFFAFSVPNLLGIFFTVYIMKETEGVPTQELKKLYHSESNKAIL
jgi:hypothetical protein